MGLTRREFVLYSVIRRCNRMNEVASTDVIRTVLTEGDNPASENNVLVVLNNLRKELAGYDEIVGHRGIGYYSKRGTEIK